MPTPVYMWAKGDTSGEIAGSVTVKGRENAVEIIDIDHDMHIPTDLHTGQPSGKRVHSPFKVRAAVDKATPLLYRAAATGENLPEVQFKFYMINQLGKEVHFYNILLTGARCTAVITDVPNVKDKTQEHFPHMIEYWFVYNAIEWQWMDGAIVYEDNWYAPESA